MVKKIQTPSVHQTAIGNDNIQVVGSHNVITRITNFFAGDTEAQRAQRNRRAMLELVKNTSIRGVLERSLYHEVLIELGMEERPGAVDRPWEMQVQMPHRSSRTLPPGTPLIQVFDEMNGAILILGEPGSGKTTMLLELARDCIARAQKDDNELIPVVFNLSSWDGKQTFDDWLVNELRTKYNVPKKIAQSWVNHADLQLLLDGLDEVKQEYRDGSVEAINDFRRQQGLTVPIAVCSRTADYEALTEKLDLQGAVVLQPLTSNQINEYLHQVGSELEGVRQVLKNDEALQELVKQPLMLTIMALAYRDIPVEKLAEEQLATLETRRMHLFNTYIQQMFERVARTKNELYRPEQTRNWLVWLAHILFQNNQTEFYLEMMQPDWLSMRLRRVYAQIIGAVAGLMLGFGLAGFMTVLRTQPVPGIFPGIADWPITEQICARNTWLTVPICEIVAWLVSFLSFGLILGILLGIAGAELMSSNIDMAMERIKPVEVIRWSWIKAKTGLTTELGQGLVTTIIGASAFGLLFGLAGWNVEGPEIGLATGLKAGVWLLLTLGPIIGLTRLLTKGLILNELDSTVQPNQRMWLSAQNATWAGLASGLAVGFASGLTSWIVFGSRGVITAPIYGFAAGVFVGLFLGGFHCIKHVVLRLVLDYHGKIPHDYIRFLDYCVDRIFLRRVGGGYIFIHRLLMEHFAAMYTADEK